MIKDSTLYCTTFPCAYCSKAIIRAGITKVVYCEGYPDELSTYLLQNIEIVKYEKKD